MRTLWVDPEEQAYPRLESDLDVDVAIVGGGLTGVGAAYALHDTGRSVAVLESRTLASGASGRNAGFLSVGTAQSYGAAAASFGRKAVREISTFTVENKRMLARLIEEREIECGFLRRGSMALAAGEEEWADLQATQRLLSEDGFPVCLVEKSQLPRPFDRLYLGGMYQAGNAELNSAQFVRTVAQWLGRRVAFFERTPVTRLRRNATWCLETPTAVVRAQSVILATNAYTDRLLPRTSIQPTRGQVLASEPLGRVIVPFPMHANNGYQYWRQTADGSLVVGGWRNLDPDAEAGTDEILHERIQGALEAFVATIVGESLPIRYRWSGIMGFTPDMLPLAGPVPGTQGLFVSAGYSGHGISMAFLCGARVAESILGGPGPPPQMDPARMLAGSGITA